MNIMDFDGTKATKDFKRLVAILKYPPDRILYLTRFRQDCKKAIESGLQSLLVLRHDFDNQGLIPQLKAKRGSNTGADVSKTGKGNKADDAVSPPGRTMHDLKNNPDLKEQVEKNLSSLSLIDDFEDGTNQSSQIVETDLVKYNVILSLNEISFK